MNNCKCCFPYVCAGSGCKRACKRHNIIYGVICNFLYTVDGEKLDLLIHSDNRWFGAQQVEEFEI